MKQLLSHSSRIRFLAAIEACTLVALVFVAVPLQIVFKHPELARILGPIHGVAFLLYVWTVASQAAGGELSSAQAKKLGLLACIPFGGFFSLRLIALERRAHPWAHSTSNHSDFHNQKDSDL